MRVTIPHGGLRTGDQLVVFQLGVRLESPSHTVGLELGGRQNCLCTENVSIPHSGLGTKEGEISYETLEESPSHAVGSERFFG